MASFINSFSLFIFLLSVRNCISKNVINFSPDDTKEIKDGESRTITYTTNATGAAAIRFITSDHTVSEVTAYNISSAPSLSIDNEKLYYGSFNISYKFIGFNNITVEILDQNKQILASGVYETSVILNYQLANQIFTLTITILIGLFNFNMGATMDFEVIKQIVKTPVGPVVGIFLQFGLFPLIGFLLGFVFFQEDTLLRLGLFIGSVCPAGGGSNMYTILLGGNLNLSIMMTFCSNIFAFGAIPLWVLLMGPIIIEGTNFYIPYDQIALIVASLLIPMGIGFATQYGPAKLQKFLNSTIKPLALFIVLYTNSFGIYTNRYIFHYFTWKVVLCGLGTPIIGYLLGVLVAFLFRQPLINAITIGIETGLQNMLIALVILKTSMGSPAGDLAFVIPACLSLMMPIPLFAAIIIKKLRQKYHEKKPVRDVEGKDNPTLDVTLENPPAEMP